MSSANTEFITNSFIQSYALRGSAYNRLLDQTKLVNSSLHLVCNIPASRQAALEQLQHLVIDTARMEFQEKEYGQVTETSEARSTLLIGKIEPIFTDLIKDDNAHNWATELTKWCVYIFGDIGNTYGAKMFGYANGVWSNLQKNWCQSKLILMIFNLLKRCFDIFITEKSSANKCTEGMTPLLEMVSRHAPNFDWIIFSLSTEYPRQVSAQILTCGLERFALLDQRTLDMSCLASIAAMLAQLTVPFHNEVKTALCSFIQTFLDLEFRSLSYAESLTGPYLLHLCSMNPPLLRALLEVLCQYLKPPLAIRLVKCSRKWRGINSVNLEATAKAALMRAQGRSFEIFSKIFSLAFEQVDRDHSDIELSVHGVAFRILDLWVRALQGICVAMTPRTAEIDECLKNFVVHSKRLASLAIHSDTRRSNLIGRLLPAICSYGGKETVFNCLYFVLKNAQTPEQLHLFFLVLFDAEIFLGPVLAHILHRIAVTFTVPQSVPVQLLKNLSTILKIEAQSDDSSVNPSFRPVCQSASTELSLRHLSLLCQFLRFKTSSDPGELRYAGLSLIESALLNTRSANISSTALRNVSRATGHILTDVLFLQQSGSKETQGRLFSSLRILNFCQSHKQGDRIYVIDSMLRSALAQIVHRRRPSDFDDQSTDHSLWSEISDSHSRRPHSLKLLKRKRNQLTCEKSIDHVNQYFMAAFTKILRSANIFSSKINNDNNCDRLDLLVTYQQLTDVHSYVGGIDSFSFTPNLEYSLSIWKTFRSEKLLFCLLLTLTENSTRDQLKPVLSMIDVLLSALAVFWNSKRNTVAKVNHYKIELASSEILIFLLGRSSVLLPPLSFCGDILHLLSPYECYLLLNDCQHYMKDSIRLASFMDNTTGSVSSAYIDNLHLIFQNNIELLGEYYGRFFAF